MYLRVKRDRLTLFFQVEPSDTVGAISARVFDSLSFVACTGKESNERTNSDKPVVGTVVCNEGVEVASAGDIALALCRCLPEEGNDDGVQDQMEDVLPVDTRVLEERATLADSKVENDDVLCILLKGEEPDDVFRRTIM